MKKRTVAVVMAAAMTIGMMVTGVSVQQHTCAWLAFDFQYIDCRADHFLY